MIKEGIEDGVPHFFSYIEDLLEFFQDFEFDHVVYTELLDPPYNLENLLAQKGTEYFRFAVKKPKK